MKILRKWVCVCPGDARDFADRDAWKGLGQEGFEGRCVFFRRAGSSIAIDVDCGALLTCAGGSCSNLQPFLEAGRMTSFYTVCALVLAGRGITLPVGPALDWT